MNDFRKQTMAEIASGNIKYKAMSRRSFLKGALAVGGALALAGCTDSEPTTNTVTVTETVTNTVTNTVTETVTVTEPSAPTEEEIEPVIKSASFILPDYVSCVGCGICMLECSMKHYGITDMGRSNIQVYGLDIKGGMIDIPILCMKCNDTPCMSVCPEKVQAISIHPTTGAILLDTEKCTVCGLCIDACNEQRTGCLRLSNEGDEVVGMCDLCDGNPVCVTYCPEHVLQILGKMHSTVGYARKPRAIAEDVYEFLYTIG